MVCHDVVGTVKQEQIIVQNIQHINPVQITNGVRGWGNALPLTKVLGYLPLWPRCS